MERVANKKAKPHAAPLPKIVSARLERKAAYEATGEAITKWQPLVKENREKPTLKFTDEERNKMNRKKSLAALNSDFVPTTDFETELMKKLEEANMATGKDVERAEDLAMNHLSVEEVKERRARLAKMRNLLFKHELKAKRVKAIKSKTFHRHNRKTGAAVKMIDGEEVHDDDAALEGLGDDADDSAEARREYLRAQERMLLKHKNTSRWAKRAIKKGLAHLPGTKEAIAEQLRIGQELKRKIGIGGERRGGGGDDGDDDDGYYSTDASDDSEDDRKDDGLSADPAERRRQLAKAKAQTLKALQDGVGTMEEAANKGGLFALPFMARAMKKRREAAEAEAKQLLEDIERADAEAASGAADAGVDGDGNGWGPTAATFEEEEENANAGGMQGGRFKFTAGKGAARGSKKPNKVDVKALRGADAADGEGASDDDDDDDDDDDKDKDKDTSAAAAAAASGVKKPRGANRAAARAAAFSAKGASVVAAVAPSKTTTSNGGVVAPVNSAKARAAARAKGAAGVLIPDHVFKKDGDDDGDDDDDDARPNPNPNPNSNSNPNPGAGVDQSDADVVTEDQSDLLRRAFASDDVVAAFETEKAAEVEGELPNVDTPKQMPGWGGWADDQARRGPPKWQLDAEKKAAKVGRVRTPFRSVLPRLLSGRGAARSRVGRRRKKRPRHQIIKPLTNHITSRQIIHQSNPHSNK